MSDVKEQEILIKELSTIFQIFENSDAEIRPHFILTGSSGSGKSFIIQTLCDKFELGFVEVDGASLTKEGISGNSLSKALKPLEDQQGALTIVFVDEFDKLFISGNSNGDHAHESSNGVQNEFLKVLESDHTSVFGEYGSYTKIDITKTLFIFAGAFNGTEDINIDTLREFGIKTEFLGRVGMVFNTSKIGLDSMINILKESVTLHKYLELFKNVKYSEVVETISDVISENYEKNTLGVRMITTLIHEYFIKGDNFNKKEAKKVTFQKTMEIK